MIAVGTVINNRLRVDAILGEGGMGVVVAATHLELGHRVAIKFLRDALAQSPEIVERFLREARSVVSLKTEHVCRVMDVGRLDTGAPYIVMEMLAGSDLQRVVERQPLPLTTAVEYVMQACIALAEAHQAGIVHRDLKPANLFVTRRFDGGPLIKVLDFGIAKALSETSAHLTSQSPMGSPGYMSPEQIHSARDVDVRTDIWALGVTLYQLLSRRLPFPAPTMTEMAIRVASAPPDPIDVDPALRATIWKCLEKDRSRRYGDVGELARDLVSFGGPSARQIVATIAQIMSNTYREPALPAGSAPTVATGVPAPPLHAPQVAYAPPSVDAPKRSRAPLIVGTLIGILGAGLGIGIAMHASRSSPQIAPAAADAREVTVALVDAQPPPPAVDAGGVIAIGDFKPDPKPPKPSKPTPKSPRPKSPAPPNATLPPPPPSPPPAPSTTHGVWEATCSKVSSRFAVVAPPGLITKCMCLKHDQAAAQQAYERISKDDREGPRTECAKLGIKLVD